MKWLDVLKAILPVVLPLVNPALGLAAPLILHGITEAEQMKGASGQQKLAHAVNIVNTGVAATNQAAGKQIIDPVVVNQTANDAISTAVDITNLVSKKSA